MCLLRRSRDRPNGARWNYSFTAASATSTLTFTDNSGTLAAPAAYECDLLLDHVRVVASSVSNTAPLADDDAYATTMGTALVVAAPGVLDGDTDGEADPLTAVLVAGPSHGSLSLNPNGSFTYTPNSGFAGTDSFSYKANDGLLDSNVATVAIVVSASAAPEIGLEQPAGTSLADGGTKNFGSVVVGSSSSLTFTIRNTGSADLTGLAITKDGANPADFTVTSSPVAPVSGPSGTTTFTVRFAPKATGSRNAVIHIANNDSNENPFDINLTGLGLAGVTHHLGKSAGDFLRDRALRHPA